jgi:hypothetical protein
MMMSIFILFICNNRSVHHRCIEEEQQRFAPALISNIIATNASTAFQSLLPQLSAPNR